MTIVVQRTTGPITVDRITTPRGVNVVREQQITVVRDSRGPVGRPGPPGPEASFDGRIFSGGAF